MSVTLKTVPQRLIAYAIVNKQGWTKQEAVDALGCSLSAINLAIIEIRRSLANTNMNLVGQRPDTWGPWTFFLTGVHDDLTQWSDNRKVDLRGRLTTIHAVLQSDVLATNGRTTTGKEARQMEKGVRRLLEDLEDMMA